jgi:hypothetical protein
MIEIQIICIFKKLNLSEKDSCQFRKYNEHISDVPQSIGTIFYDSNGNVINGNEPLSKRKKTCPLDKPPSKKGKKTYPSDEPPSKRMKM